MTASRLSALLVLSSIATTGCGSGSGSGASPAECEPVDSRALAWSERSTLGFSADELLSALGTQHEARLTKSDTTSTALHLALAHASSGGPALQTRERQVAGSEAEACADVLSVPVALSFTTTDGTFDETWPLDLNAEAAGRATGHGEFDLRTLDGSYTVSQVDPEAFDQLVGLLDIELEASAWNGALSGRARTDGAANTAGQPFDIGTFH